MDYPRRCFAMLVGIALALTGSTASLGCGDDTGLLVEVTRDPVSTPADIETLEIVIGVSQADAQGRYIKDASSTSDVAMNGRDLATSPYQVLLHNGGASDASITIAIIARKGGEPVGFAGFDGAQTFVSGQVLKRTLTLVDDPSVRLGDTGCVTWYGPGDTRNQIASPDDKDCDGDLADVDCNDLDGDIGPSRTETCGNGIDDNCNEMIDEETDADEDNFTNCQDDCVDDDATIFPGAPELCDGLDNDCNTFCDDGALDADGDHYNTCGEKILDDGTCVDAPAPDCDDGDDHVNPAATEVCDGQDNDCDGSCDVGDGIDEDHDGFTACGTIPSEQGSCTGPLDGLVDCKDGDAAVNPGQNEVCDGKDDDCDGQPEQSEPCYVMAEGECRLGTAICDDDGSDMNMSGLGACQPNAFMGLSVPAALCSAYAECRATTTPPPNWFECANSMAANSHKIACTLAHTGTELCDERSDDLPKLNLLAQSCTWQLLGGQTQTHYNVGLTSGGGSPQGSVDVCAPLFIVTDKLDFFARTDTIYMQYGDNLLPQKEIVALEITPVLVATCPQEALACMLLQ